MNFFSNYLPNNSFVHLLYLSGHDVTCTADGLEFLVRVTEVEVLNFGRKMAPLIQVSGDRGSTVVKVLCYKS